MLREHALYEAERLGRPYVLDSASVISYLPKLRGRAVSVLRYYIPRLGQSC